MKLNILKSIIYLLILSATAINAQREFVKECLDVKDLTVICEVNSEGKINHVELYIDTITDKEIEKLLSYETITKLDVRGKYDKLFYTQTFIDLIGSMKNLEELDIYEFQKKDKKINFDAFKNLTKVKNLALWATEDGKFEREILGKFANVERLELWNPKLNQNDIKTIGSYKKLKELKLYQVDFEKNLDFSPFKNIETLYITGDNSKVSKEFIKSFKNLKKLYIEGRQPYIDQSFIDELANISSVEDLYLSFKIADDKEVNLNVLKKLINLSNLNLEFYDDTIDLNGFKSIKTLNLYDVHLTQALVTAIGEFPKIETLYITYNADSDSLDFSPLKKNKSLSTLYLNGSNDKYDHNKKIEKGTLEGFNYIKKFYFHRIVFRQRDINDLAALPNLKEIEFDFCYLVNGNIDALKSKKDLVIKGLDEEELIFEENISTNGKCGEEDGKCPDGKCCSKYGYCGTSDKHCDAGCQSEFGKCNSKTTTIIKTKTTATTRTTTKSSLPTSTNGRCGKSDGRCPSGKCCSKYGYCGKSDDHCGKGCQSEFGECKNTSSTKTKTTTKTTTKTKATTKKTTKKTTTKSSLPTSTNDKCGKTDGICPSGKCCSKYGWCGTTDAHCGTGCQREYGKCK